jgi:hypothetical protein
MSGPWTRDDWNDIIRRVNDLAQNPPDDTDCDPLSTIEEVGPSHVWARSDIEEVQNKLVEICDENTFSAELRLWAQEIIDEIEAAIANGWCGCEEECVPECSNAHGNVEEYCGSFTTSECHNCNVDGCPDTCTAESRQLATAQGGVANSKIGQWADAWSAYCSLDAQVRELQAQLDALEAQLAALEQARDQACASGDEEACNAAQAAVDAKQGEVDAKQADLDQKTQQRDQKQQEADAYEQEAETAAAASIAYADAVGADVITVPYTSFITGDGTWADIACDQLGPECLGRDPRRCRVWWSVQQKTTQIMQIGYTWVGNWTTQMGGGFTRAGNPYVTYIRACGGVPKYACASYGPHACENGCSSTYIHEIRSIMAFPDPTGEQCCD